MRRRLRSRARASPSCPAGSFRRARRPCRAAAPAPVARAGALRSSVRLSLLRLMLRKYALSLPMNGGPHARVSSPLPGCSILITRAPMSASSIVQYGPESTRVKSRTVMPASGAVEGISDHSRNRRPMVTRSLRRAYAVCTSPPPSWQMAISSSRSRPAGSGRSRSPADRRADRPAGSSIGSTTGDLATAWRCATSFSRLPARPGGNRARGVAGSDPGAPDVVWRDARAHQHVRKRGSLRRGVPAIDIERRIRFGDAVRLHPRERGLERFTRLERGQDVVRRAVDDPAESRRLSRSAASREPD